MLSGRAKAGGEYVGSLHRFLRKNAIVIGSLGGLAGVMALLTGALKWPFSKSKPTQLADETIEKIKPPSLTDQTALTVPQFIAIRREMKADLEKELSEAHEDEKAELRARIAEMETQIADPEPALADAQKTIAELTERLTRMGNDVGGDRLADAQAAFARLDYSVADDIFAEVEERQRLEVEQAARAAYGRGEIAEAEIRWHDAAKHYARAARLDPSFDTLFEACKFALLAGDADQAFRWGEELIAIAKNDGDEKNIATALNEHALSLKALGKYEEAEGLYREALAIDEKTIGVEHPEYAIRLWGLAMVLAKSDEVGKARVLLNQVLTIFKEKLPEDHPHTAKLLGHIASLDQP